jgi:hypothetical protein
MEPGLAGQVPVLLFLPWQRWMEQGQGLEQKLKGLEHRQGRP